MRYLSLTLLLACVHIRTERNPGEWVRSGASPGTTQADGEFSYFVDQLADERQARSLGLMEDECPTLDDRRGPAYVVKEWTVDGHPPRHHIRFRCGVPDAGE